MVFIYWVGIKLYGCVVWVASFFHIKARQWVTGRKKWKQNLQTVFFTHKTPVAWFHCASLGEFEQGRPLIEQFHHTFPDYTILLTFFSPSGYEIRKNYTVADHVCYLPLDIPSNARFFLDVVKPSVVFFIKYEFWYFFIREIKNRAIPLLGVSYIFRADQLFFRWYGKWYRKMLYKFEHFFLQNESSQKLLESYGIRNVTVAGDTRFDRVVTIRESVRELPWIEKFKDNKSLFIIGSSWPADMSILLPVIKKNRDLKFIIVPHEIDMDQLIELQHRLPFPSLFYSHLISNLDIPIAEFPILIIDEIGLLSSLYAYAEYAFIGGGFGKGIHNTLEAAVFGIPIFIGPRYHQFQEAVDLVEKKSIFPVATSEELAHLVHQLKTNSAQKTEIKTTTLNYIKMKTGATDTVITYLKQRL